MVRKQEAGSIKVSLSLSLFLNRVVGGGKVMRQ